MANNGAIYLFEELGNIHIVNVQIFNHKTMCFNYTTYNLCHDYNIINSSKHANVMAVSLFFDPSTNSATDEHPFLYAHVLGIYHADFVHMKLETSSTSAHTLEFVLAHWYQRDTTFDARFQHHQLY